MYQLGHYLLVKAPDSKGKHGVALLDTGSNMSALGNDWFTPATLRAPSIALQSWTNRNGVKLSGVLGFPAIRHNVLTLNYRDGYWKLWDRRDFKRHSD